MSHADLTELPIQELAVQVGAEYQVPSDLLLALSWVGSSLSPIHGGHGECSPVAGWLGLSPAQVSRAVSLTGLAPELVEEELVAAFVASAALLAQSRNQLAPMAGSQVDAKWWPVVERWPGLGERWLDQEFALAVFGVLQRGLDVQAANGDPVVLSARSMPGLADVELLPPDTSGAAREVPAYGYGAANRFVAASPANYSSRPGGISAIDMVVIHTTEGSYDGAISWFRNPGAEVSAHYVLRKSDGEVTQMVSDHKRAWHAGGANNRSIGIEHEGSAANASTWTPPLLESSARLSAWLSETYDIPIDRTHFVGHSEVAGGKVDPGVHFPWTEYIEMVKCFRYGGSNCSDAHSEDMPPSGSGSSSACSGSCSGSWNDDEDEGTGGASEVDAGSSWVRLVEPRSGDQVSNPVTLRAERSGGPWVEFWAGAFRIGSPTSDNPADVTTEFFLSGDRTLSARLYSSSGVLLDTDTVAVKVRRTQGEMSVWPTAENDVRWSFTADVLDVVGEVDYVTFAVDGEALFDSDSGADRVWGTDFRMVHRFEESPNGALLVARAFDHEGVLLASDSAVLDGEGDLTPHCSMVGTLRCGDVIEANTALAPEASNHLDAYPEIPGNFSGPELGYHLDFGAAARVELSFVDARPFEINHDLILLDAGSGFCFADALVKRGFNSLEFEPVGSRNYILVVDGYGGDAGAFELEMDCH